MDFFVGLPYFNKEIVWEYFCLHESFELFDRFTTVFGGVVKKRIIPIEDQVFDRFLMKLSDKIVPIDHNKFFDGSEKWVSNQIPDKYELPDDLRIYMQHYVDRDHDRMTIYRNDTSLSFPATPQHKCVIEDLLDWESLSDGEQIVHQNLGELDYFLHPEDWDSEDEDEFMVVSDQEKQAIFQGYPHHLERLIKIREFTINLHHISSLPFKMADWFLFGDDWYGDLIVNLNPESNLFGKIFGIYGGEMDEHIVPMADSFTQLINDCLTHSDQIKQWGVSNHYHDRLKTFVLS